MADTPIDEQRKHIAAILDSGILLDLELAACHVRHARRAVSRAGISREIENRLVHVISTLHELANLAQSQQ